jgi:hypothetical protein
MCTTKPSFGRRAICRCIWSLKVVIEDYYYYYCINWGNLKGTAHFEDLGIDGG